MACTAAPACSVSRASSARCPARGSTRSASARRASMQTAPIRTHIWLRFAKQGSRRTLSNKEMQQVETAVLPIRGMTCAACQAHVERSLRAAPGVVDATVNLLAHSARVMYEPARSSLRDLVNVVDEAGYEAGLPSEPTSSIAHDHMHDEGDSGEGKRQLAVALA